VTDKKLDLYIAIPTVRDWKPEFGVSMIGLSVHLTRQMKDKIIRGFYVNNKITSHLPKGRQMMLDEAMEGEFTHILFIDDDQKFTPQCLDMMLSRKKPFVSANICKKSIDDGGWIASYGEGRRVNSTGKTGIEPALTVGLGFALLDLDFVRKTKKPHFEMCWIDEIGGYIGEDVYFCAKMKHHAGVIPWIDNDASNIVTHVGNYEYGARDVPAEKTSEVA